MTTKQSQAVTELFNMRSVLQSMNGEKIDASPSPVHLLDERGEPHPTETRRMPELFSELCC